MMAYLKNIFKHSIFLKHTMAMHIKFWHSTAMYISTPKTYTLAGFEPGIFCSLGGRDDH
jgi:hypothetical protein